MKEFKKILHKIKSDNFWKNLFKNSFWAFFGDASASAITFIISIILIKIIGSESYGILILAQSYMNIMDVIINIQSWRSTIQYGQKAIVDGNDKELHSYVKLGCIMDISTAILCFIISILLPNLIGGFLHWSNEMILCSEIFAITIISHFAGTPTAILRLFNKYNLVALSKTLAAIFKITAIVAYYLITKNLNLVSSTIIFMLTDFIGNILLVIFAFYHYSKKYKIADIIKAKMPKDAKSFISYTLWGTLSEIVDLPVQTIDVFIVSVLGNATVAIYKIFKQIIGIISKVTGPIQQSILPQFSELSAKGNEKRGFEVVIKIHKTILKYTLPISILVGATSYIWLGKLYDMTYANYWYILFIYLMIQTYALSYTTIHPFFITLGNMRINAIIEFTANIVYLIVSYILVRAMGLLGITIAFLIQILLNIFLKYFCIKKMIENTEEKI
jgi:polysaccharide biosynthesis protein